MVQHPSLLLKTLDKAVFLDKDGTLIEDVPYNVNPELIRLTSGAELGLRSLHNADASADCHL